MQNRSFWKEIWLLLICIFMGIGIMTTVLSFLSIGSDVVRMHVTQWLQTILVMLVPALFWYRIRFGKNPFRTFCLMTCRWKHLLLTLVLMVVSVPAMDMLTVFNYTMPMPEALRTLAMQMRTENIAAVSKLLSVGGIGGMVELVMLMAVATAIAEETLFRGALVKCFELTRLNRHWTAILVGMIFSIVHFDPLGFIPRWVLGTLFCYILFWTGTLWAPILAHATNNAVALAQYEMSAGEASVENLLNQSKLTFSWPVIVASVVMSAIIILLMCRNKKL